MFRGVLLHLGCKLLLSLAVCSPLAAQDRTVDYRRCADGNLADDTAAACTRIIDDPGESRQNRAGAYNNRGLWYARNRDFDRAIADYGEAARLNPENAQAYLNR